MSESEEFSGLPAEIQAKSVASQLPSFADLAKEASAGGELVTVGEEYIRLDNKRDQKRQLVGVPFIIEAFDLIDGQNGTFAVVRLVTNQNERFSFTDGGAGIPSSLEHVEEGQRVLCRQGLRASDYDGPAGPATTYYLT